MKNQLTYDKKAKNKEWQPKFLIPQHLHMRGHVKNWWSEYIYTKFTRSKCNVYSTQMSVL